MRALSSDRCTDARLYTLRLMIGTRTTSVRERSHCWTRLGNRSYEAPHVAQPFFLHLCTRREVKIIVCFIICDKWKKTTYSIFLKYSFTRVFNFVTLLFKLCDYLKTAEYIFFVKTFCQHVEWIGKARVFYTFYNEIKVLFYEKWYRNIL